MGCAGESERRWDGNLLMDTASQSKRVRLVGNHPHRGKTGTVQDDQPMKWGMWLIELDDGGGCYAEPERLRPLPHDEDPGA